MASKPRFPSDRQVLTNSGLISQEWSYWLRAIDQQVGQSGTFAVTASNPLLISTSATELKFNSDGTTYRNDTLHFPPLTGDVTNNGLTTSLVNIGTPVVNKLVNLTTDSKGRVIGTTDVSQLDLTSILGSYYVNRAGDTMTGNLTVPSMLAQASVTSPLVNVDNIQFNVSPVSKLTTPGSLSWNDTDGCLDIVMKGGNVVLQVGQESVQRMVNKSGVNVTDGQAVYVFGAQGNRVSFKLANANSEATSKATLGIVTEPIANNGEGFVTTEGLVRGLNTSAWLEGDVIYLNSVDGGLTNVQQVYPNHNVTIGYVVRSHAVNGSIYVKVNNGYELEELHNVVFTSLASNDLLKYDGAKWVNTVSAAKADTLTTARTISLSGDATGSVSFNGSANVSIATTLANVATAGTYKSVTVDAKGRVTAGTNPTTLAGYNITDAVPLAGGVTITSAITINNAGGGSLQAVGRTGPYGSTNGTTTGAVNVVMGTGGSASWGLSMTSAGTFRCGIQGLDAGGAMRFYVGASAIEQNGSNWQPIANNTGTLGTSSLNWSALYVNNVYATGNVSLSSIISKMGYVTGAGAAVTQLTSKSTGVTNNRSSGQITMHNAALAANTSVAFTLTNSQIAAADNVIVSIAGGASTLSYLTQVEAIAAGSCRIALRNITAASLSEAVVLTFTVIAGATA